MSGGEIRRIREALGLTQAQLASVLGVHSVTVSRWESGGLSPTPYQIGLIEQFALAAQRKPRAVDEDIAKVLVTAGAIAGLYLLLKRALEAKEDGGAEVDSARRNRRR